MRYNKGKCLEDFDKIQREYSYNSREKYILRISGEDELYSKFNFDNIAQSSVYLNLLLQQCTTFEAETHGYICEINNLSSGIWGSIRKLKKYLKLYFELVENENEIKSEINTLLKYRVTKGAGCIDDESITMVIACYEKIEKDSQIMFNLINIHMRDISGARVSTTNILISMVAVIVAVVLSA